MEDYDVLDTIGEGAFGRVSKVRRKTDGEVTIDSCWTFWSIADIQCSSQILVWKELNYGRMTDREKQLLVSEVNILRELNNPNIVKYYDRIIGEFIDLLRPSQDMPAHPLLAGFAFVSSRAEANLHYNGVLQRR